MALQRAGLDYVNAYAKILAKAYEVYEETGRWPESSQLDEGTAYAGHEEAFFRLLSTRAQVFDDELRDLATELRVSIHDTLWEASDAEEVSQERVRVRDAIFRFEERVHVLLKELM